ncbi:MAG TPA: hypothetical protein VFJ85_13395 [Acidimicrobiales bacterium]|nr:hypothetical protein [Acidimicrobiales bacterium]
MGGLGALLLVAVLGAAAPGGAAGGKPTTTTSASTTTSTTVPPSTTSSSTPYGLPDIDIINLTITASLSSLNVSGSFVVRNTGMTSSVVVLDQTITLEYKTSKTAPYQPLPAPTCTYSPSAPYTVVTSQTVTYNCQMASSFPSNAKYVRVTVTAHIQGNTMTYTDRGDKAL